MASRFKPGLSERARVKIITVDPATRRVQGAFKDGAPVHIAVWDVPNAFRWPVEGEEWIIRRDSGFWTLDRRQQFDKRDNVLAISAMQPGQMVLDSVNIFNAVGERLATVAAPGIPRLTLSGALTITVIASSARSFLKDL